MNISEPSGREKSERLFNALGELAERFSHMPEWGAPWFHYPPIAEDYSNMVGMSPSSNKDLADRIPQGPPPITATVFLVFRLVFCILVGD